MDAIVGQRQVIDYINRAGGAANVHISKKMIASASNARNKYHAYLEESSEIKQRKCRNRDEKR